jgi:hypothetical protein
MSLTDSEIAAAIVVELKGRGPTFRAALCADLGKRFGVRPSDVSVVLDRMQQKGDVECHEGLFQIGK